MFKFFGLVLLSALAVVGAEKVNINGFVDKTLENMNDKMREQGLGPIPQAIIPLSPGIKYSNAVSVGIDSFKRTGDCWQEVKGQNTTFDVHYGYGLMAIAIGHLDIHGKNMSAYIRVKDNSVHLVYTKHGEGANCHIKLHTYDVEKLENIEFGASRPEYDGINVDGYFKTVVVPTMNSIVQKRFSFLEYNLQALCYLKVTQSEAHIQGVLINLMNNY